MKGNVRDNRTEGVMVTMQSIFPGVPTRATDDLAIRGGVCCSPQWPLALTKHVRSVGFAACLAVLAWGTLPGAAEAKEAPTRQLTQELIDAFSSTTTSGRYLAALHAGKERDIITAADLYWSILEQGPDNESVWDRALLYQLAAGRMDNGFVIAEKLVNQKNMHRLANLVIGIRSLKNREYVKARGHFDVIIENGKEDLGASLLAAWATMGAAGAKEAIAAIDALPNENWYQSFKDFHAGLMADIEGLDSQATRRLKDAYEVENVALRVMEAYARRLLANKQKDKALAVVSKYGETSNNLPYLTQLQKDIAEGEAARPLVKTVQEGAAEALYGYGTALRYDGAEDIGAMYLQFARYLDDDSEWVLFSLADTFDTLDNKRQAIAYYDAIPAQSTLRRNAEIKVGLNLYDIGEKEEAERRLETLIDENPGDLDAVISLGVVLRDQEKYAKAAEVYSRGIEAIEHIREHHWRIYYHRGIAYERTNVWAKAEVDFLKSLELSKDQPLVLNYLGYSWVDQGIHLRRALKMIERAVALRPRDGFIVDSLGWAHYKLGNYTDAVKELERAVQLRPHDPTINDHLGDAYWQIGRKLEARFQWIHARDLKPEPDQLEKILAKIKNGMPEEPSDTAAKVNEDSQN